MRKHLLITALLAIFLSITFQLSAQVGINTDGSQPDPSAGLDVKFSNKGFLPPRMTHVEMNAIPNPASGLIVLCTDCGLNGTAVISVFMNGAWNTIATNCILPSAPTAVAHVPSPTQIIWNWNTVSGATGYKWSTTNNYGTATDMSTAISKTETGLTCNTAYTRYAWAYSACGNSTAVTLTQTTSVCPPTCGTPMTDARDGKTYNTVLIGTQCWMAQNLNIGTKVLGSANQTNNGIIEKYCYNDDENNCAVYGGLYQWDEAMQYSTTEGVKGICPTGWHLPTDAEWTTLTTFLGGESIAGGKMKEAGLTHWASPNTGATNSSGFTALPGGDRDGNGGFYDLAYGAIFWSSSQYDPTIALFRALFFSVESVYRGGTNKTTGRSSRCVQD